MKTIAVIACLVCAAVAVQWEVVDKDFTSISMANSFHAPGTGWIFGSSASLTPQVLYTTDGGDTLSNVGLTDSSVGAFFSVDTTTDGQTGIAGGFGFLGLPCGAYMQDGKTWSTTHAGREIVCALTDANAIDNKNLIMTGTWVEPLDFGGNGCQVSTDGGKNWNSRNWVKNPDDGIEPPVAKYSSFIDINTGFISGGSFPQKPQQSAAFKDISRYFRVFKDGRIGIVPEEDRVANYKGYSGLIVSATDAVKTVKVMVNLTHEGFYFNQINCVDSKTCWAAAEGLDKNTLQPTSWIYHTSDGWNTYDVQMTAEGAGIVAVSMLNSTFGWAGGAMLSGNKFSGTFWQTTDGTNWNQYNEQLNNFFVFDISTVDANDAYANGLTSAGLSSFARYQA